MKLFRALSFCLLSLGIYFLSPIPKCLAEDPKVSKREVIVAEDPYLWLEEVEGERALNWVREQNQRTTAELEANPVYPAVLAAAKEILFANDRVPFSSFEDGYFWNFWQDETHTHGVLRRTVYDEYLKAAPKWETILDLDKLSTAENENWVYGGGVRLDKNSSRRLLRLSRGGKDAKVVREFDYETREFVTDGFNVPEAKTDLTPVDENTVLIGTDFGAGTLTTSGYPRIIKLWRRGEPLSKAKKIFEASPTDLAAGSHKIQHGDERYILFSKAISFFEADTYLMQEDGRLRRLPIPRSANLLDIRDGYIYIQLKEEVNSGSTQLGSGGIIRVGLTDDSLEKAELVFQPEKGQSIAAVTIAEGRIFINLLVNIRSRVIELKENAEGQFVSRELPFPSTGVISFGYKNEDDATSFSTIYYTDHLTPERQYRVHDEDDTYRLELLKSAPTSFDSSAFEVVQNFATSADGTKIPYFLIKDKNLVLDGSHPTILYGYGGFEVSLSPNYLGEVGKLWLERGNVYVIANIRGGGEFGPEWHQAAIRENRQKAFDDFAAVAEDLIAKKVTSPAHLGINGGSNGGLLTGTVMVQRPELFNAALVQVPLLDMLRFSKLLAGASWIGEYGDPDVPADRECLSKYSPYCNVRPDRQYPKAMFTTSTKDDRVHPGHARKMVARMMEQGHPVLYFENTNGGHAGSANLEESARMAALEYTYLCQQLSASPARDDGEVRR